MSLWFLYDFYVQRRNMKITSTAQRSTAIVASLFPQKVADQMMEEVEDGQQRDGKSSRSRLSEAVRLMNGASPTTENNTTHDGESRHKEPIADLFQNTTIMFADIAGFTSWCSKREPADVFKLLEAIFNSFDRLAERHGIFKVCSFFSCSCLTEQSSCSLLDTHQF